MSTPTDAEIAAVKRVVLECESNGYEDFPSDPYTYGHLIALRAVLKRLEGLAAPGEPMMPVWEFLDCASYDALMEGPAFKGWNRSALDRLRRKYEALLADVPPGEGNG